MLLSRTLKSAAADALGADVSIENTVVPATGTYYVRAGVLGSPPAAGLGTEFPTHFTERALVSIKQP